MNLLLSVQVFIWPDSTVTVVAHDCQGGQELSPQYDARPFRGTVVSETKSSNIAKVFFASCRRTKSIPVRKALHLSPSAWSQQVPCLTTPAETPIASQCRSLGLLL